MVSQARLPSWPTAFGATFRFTTVCVCVSLCVCVSFAWELRAWDTRRWQPQYAARLPSPPTRQVDHLNAISQWQRRWHNWFKSLIFPAGAIKLLFSIAFLLLFFFLSALACNCRWCNWQWQRKRERKKRQWLRQSCHHFSNIFFLKFANEGKTKGGGKWKWLPKVCDLLGLPYVSSMSCRQILPLLLECCLRNLFSPRRNLICDCLKKNLCEKRLN